MLQKHFDYTGSTKAKDILDNFAQYQSKFIKVISPTYKNILYKPAAEAATV